ncbi:unnamed protein product [Prunus armeniaca]|uniref:Uncharacterized protein n=1 Tax=Prunus armeniaca TaxID=36596 RepID=A0A6J5XRN3_PRUAR|nr:unnamed protein product [Prunus armeniaca]
MKELIGRPGSVSGLLLRIGQFSCASIAISVMVTTDGFATFTAFCDELHNCLIVEWEIRPSNFVDVMFSCTKLYGSVGEVSSDFFVPP